MATITSVDLYLGLYSAKSGFNVVVEIYTLGSHANDPDVGSLLGSKAIDVDNIPLISGVGPDWVTFTFDTPITVSSNDFAGIVFDSLGSNYDSDFIRHYHAQDYDYYTSGAKAGTERGYINHSGNWVDQGAGSCLCYRINGTDITQNVADNPSASYEMLGGRQHGFRAYVDGESTIFISSLSTPEANAVNVFFTADSHWSTWNRARVEIDGAWWVDTSWTIGWNPTEPSQRTRPFNLTADTQYSVRIEKRSGSPGNYTYEYSNTETFITASGNPPIKATNPSPTNANTSVTLDHAALTWVDGGGSDTYNIYYGITSGSLSLVSTAQAGESFTVTGVTDGSPYAYLSVRYWRIDSTNDDGTTTGDEWLFTTIRLDPPTKTYFYATTGQYYRLLIQSDRSYGDPPGVGVENTDYVYLAAGYEHNAIATTRKLIAAAENRIWYEDI